MVERRSHNPKVAGSIPAPATTTWVAGTMMVDMTMRRIVWRWSYPGALSDIMRDIGKQRPNIPFSKPPSNEALAAGLLSKLLSEEDRKLLARKHVGVRRGRIHYRKDRTGRYGHEENQWWIK